MRMKEKGEQAGLKLNLKKTKIMASGPITSQQPDGDEKCGKANDGRYKHHHDYGLSIKDGVETYPFFTAVESFRGT